MDIKTGSFRAEGHLPCGNRGPGGEVGVGKSRGRGESEEESERGVVLSPFDPGK